jgi:hypothetical protein
MAHTINILFNNPVIENDKRISIVDIINPEFLITLWNSSVKKNENNNNITSAKIRKVKNCSKKMLLILANEELLLTTGLIIFIDQSTKE